MSRNRNKYDGSDSDSDTYIETKKKAGGTKKKSKKPSKVSKTEDVEKESESDNDIEFDPGSDIEYLEDTLEEEAEELGASVVRIGKRGDDEDGVGIEDDDNVNDEEAEDLGIGALDSKIAGDDEDEVDEIIVEEELVEHENKLVDKHLVKSFQKSRGEGIVFERIITGKDRVISEFMTVPVFNELISVRAKHISRGAEPYVDIKGYTSAEQIAIAEMMQKKFPLSVKLPRGNAFELWSPNEMVPPRQIID
jgi:hypothetical protein